MDELAHWDCWGSCGRRHIDRPEPNSTPEAAVKLLTIRLLPLDVKST